jgi:hypothetical protein
MTPSIADIKTAVKRRAPWLIPLYSFLCWNLVIRPRWRKAGMQIFEEHYRTNAWRGDESASGTGSSLAATEVVRTILPQIVRRFGIASLLDIPCGDFNWMQHLDLPISRYIGADVVEELIAENRRRFSDSKRTFLSLDLTTDPLPPSDLVLCRDCLFHFSFFDISRAIANIMRSDVKLLLTTTYPTLHRNRNVVTGEWRPLNLQIAPFSFPEPLMLIDEKSDDKHLGLWRVSDLQSLPLSREVLDGPRSKTTLT